MSEHRERIDETVRLVRQIERRRKRVHPEFGKGKVLLAPIDEQRIDIGALHAKRRPFAPIAEDASYPATEVEDRAEIRYADAIGNKQIVDALKSSPAKLGEDFRILGA